MIVLLNLYKFCSRPFDENWSLKSHKKKNYYGKYY